MLLTRLTKFFLGKVEFDRWIEVESAVTGAPDPETGYLLDITEIDSAVRTVLPPLLVDAAKSGEPLTTTIAKAAAALAPLLAVAGRSNGSHVQLAWMSLALSPFRSVSCHLHPSSTLANPSNSMTQPHIEITASYEFAASHRLHCATRSDEENRRLFGKCNNPNGHGHNYTIEVRCKVPKDHARSFEAVDAAVESEILRRFDHRHLNLDCPEFATLNPSVENIAMICFNYLKPALDNAGIEARSVRVHETPKTSAIYPG
jgi:6-pyruvoyltetrahydropterin/6-carboxytetrahydropterin synthase